MECAFVARKERAQRASAVAVADSPRPMGLIARATVARGHALDDVERERDDAEDDVTREAAVEPQHLLQHPQPEARPSQLAHL